MPCAGLGGGRPWPTGEIFDPETGLQYLNARYYDPRLGMFIQPDWWEVTERGVGTNRFAYSMNDPLNKMDPNGNAIPEVIWAGAALFAAVVRPVKLPETTQLTARLTGMVHWRRPVN